MPLAFCFADFVCSRIPCYYFRLLPRKIPSSGILSAATCCLASLPLPDRNGRKLVYEWEVGGNAGRSIRIVPLQSAKTLGNGSNIQPKRNDPCVVPFNSILTFLPLLSGSGDEARQQVAAVQIPLDGIWLGAAGNSSTEYGYTRICTNKKKEDKNPLS